MRYMGGKERQAAHIVRELLARRGGCTNYLEPFLGGASVFSRIAPHFPGSAVGSDAHPDLVLMWQAARDGWVPPTEMTREEYDDLRHAEPSALRAFAGFGLSFGGKFFGGYATSRGDDYCGAAHRGVLKKAVGMAGQEIVHADYRSFNPGPGTLVYCDPPYAGTTGYSVGGFDPDRFWATVRGWAEGGAEVFVSEYGAPEWAGMVWERQALRSLRKDSNKLPSVEKLFRVPAASSLPIAA